MGNSDALVIFLILIALPIIVLAKDEDKLKKYSIQFKYGIANTFHYNAPISITPCIEYCIAEEQKPGISTIIDLSIYKKFNTKNSLKVGIGFSEYVFWEKGLGFPNTPYTQIREYMYFNFSTGFRHVFNGQKLFSPIFETVLVCEIYTGGSYIQKAIGVAAMQQIGTIIKFSNKVNGIVQVFYKSGITKYNSKRSEKAYIPYGYGIQIGFGFKL